MTERTGPRILIIRLSAIGDVVVTTPVARALREAFPDAHLSWLVEPRAAEIVQGNPFLDEVIVWDRKKGGLSAGALMDLRRRLRPMRFDWAVDCQGLLRSGLAARLSGARRVVGNVGAKEQADRLYHVRVPRSTTDLSSRQRCLDLLRPLGVESSDRRMLVPISEAARGRAGEVLDAEGLAPGEPYACLVPWTTWPQKHWRAEYWSELASSFQKRLGLTPVILGGPGDAAGSEGIAREAGSRCVVAAGKTSLQAAAALLEGARVTVAVDTALMHASVALGTPTVGVCGASWFPGFQDYEQFELVREEMACSPCLHRPVCGGRWDCMQAVTPERVLAAARGLLGTPVPVLS